MPTIAIMPMGTTTITTTIITTVTTMTMTMIMITIMKTMAMGATATTTPRRISGVPSRSGSR